MVHIKPAFADHLIETSSKSMKVTTSLQVLFAGMTAVSIPGSDATVLGTTPERQLASAESSAEHQSPEGNHPQQVESTFLRVEDTGANTDVKTRRGLRPSKGGEGRGGYGRGGGGGRGGGRGGRGGGRGGRP